jgi:hypothetical protein
MYTEGFQQWLNMNKYLNAPLTDWNKTFTGIYQRLTQHQLDLLGENFSRMSEQLKKFSNIKKPEDYLSFQKDMINEEITASIDNMHSLLRESMLQLEELMKLFSSFNETATHLSKNNPLIHNKGTEKEKSGH